jgi:hypothetical protein
MAAKAGDTTYSNENVMKLIDQAMNTPEGDSFIGKPALLLAKLGL